MQVKPLQDRKENSVRGSYSKSSAKKGYDYVSTLLNVMRELDHEYTLNPNFNQKIDK
jgi:hypothetical protein